MAKHVHAEAMAMFAEDAKISETPWKFWETRESKTKKNGVWVEDWEDLEEMPDWNPNVGYRRKIQTITIEGIVFPLPYKGEVVKGQKYYYADTDIGDLGYAVKEVTHDNCFTGKLLEVLSGMGNIFLHEEAAKMRVKALHELDKKILGGE